MQKYINAVAATNAAAGTAGAPVAGASVQVNVQSTGLPATIYSDNGVTLAANPLTTDTNGSFSFYAADGRYQLVISGANIQTTTLNDILLVDPLPADLATTLPSSSGKLWNNGGVISVS
ncbi:hypothetical protein [Paraburkholderia sediminicola]|uniref:hypothetical protein n=1 Tax=Paraburkholderia sediminicola TaxID=458836 RepID=UPI0038BDC0D2